MTFVSIIVSKSMAQHHAAPYTNFSEPDNERARANSAACIAQLSDFKHCNIISKRHWYGGQRAVCSRGFTDILKQQLPHRVSSLVCLVPATGRGQSMLQS